jgi:hypothetical protein
VQDQVSRFQSILNYLSTVAAAEADQLPLFSHFLELRTEHVDVSIVQVATEHKVEPVSLFALDGEFVDVGVDNTGGLSCITPRLREGRSAINLSSACPP